MKTRVDSESVGALLAAAKMALPWLVLLGDKIGNGTPENPNGRCDAILALKDAIAIAEPGTQYKTGTIEETISPQERARAIFACRADDFRSLADAHHVQGHKTEADWHRGKSDAYRSAAIIIRDVFRRPA
jgi:hypothetical protein